MTTILRYSLEADLVVESDLHIGTSDDAVSTAEDASRNIAKVARGIQGNKETPFIPASSLKGVLKATIPQDSANTLFGVMTDHTQKEGGKIAQLWLQNAFLSVSWKQDTGFEAVQPASASYLRTGIALDPDRSTASDNMLYERQMIVPGARFKFRAVWFGSLDNDDLLNLLAVMNSGFRAGYGTSKGNGRLILDLGTLKIVEDAFDSDGRPLKRPLSDADQMVLRRRAQQISPRFRTQWRIINLNLQCSGPFMSQRGDESGPNDRQVVMPLTSHDGKPLIWREGLKGALRSRARWIAELNRARDPIQFKRSDDIPMDDRNLERALDGRRYPKADDLEALSAVERLFGVTGLRGKLEVTDISCTHTGQSQDITSNSLDRVSGGGRDGFLYTERVFWEPTFQAILHVPSLLRDDEQKLLVQLLDSLKSDGLELGHGTSKGYGWCDVTVDNDLNNLERTR